MNSGDYITLAIIMGLFSPAIYRKGRKIYYEQPKLFKIGAITALVLISMPFAIWCFKKFQIANIWNNLPNENQNFLMRFALIVSAIIIIPWLLFFILLYIISIIRGQLHTIYAMEEAWGGTGLVLYLLLWVFLLPVMITYTLIRGLIMCPNTLKMIKEAPSAY